MRDPTRAEPLDIRSPERLRLLEDAWDTFVADSDSYLLSDRDREEIDHELDAMTARPHAASGWSEVKQRILNLR